jgi:hypothetical protein
MTLRGYKIAEDSPRGRRKNHLNSLGYKAASRKMTWIPFSTNMMPDGSDKTGDE